MEKQVYVSDQSSLPPSAALNAGQNLKVSPEPAVPFSWTNESLTGWLRFLSSINCRSACVGQQIHVDFELFEVDRYYTSFLNYLELQRIILSCINTSSFAIWEL